MTHSFHVRFLPSGTEINVPSGTMLIDAIHDAGIHFELPCGGDLRCGRCKVRIESGHVPPGNHPHISPDESAAGLRLACQTVVEDNLEIHILPRFYIQDSGPSIDQDFDSITQFMENRTRSIPFEPFVKAHTISIPVASLQDQTGDAVRLQRALKQKTGITRDLNIPLHVLRKLSRTISESDRRIQVIMSTLNDQYEVIDVVPVNNRSTKWIGAAIDIGTTTIGINIVDLNNGSILSHITGFNNQILFGDDVITRIVYSGRSEGLEKLRSAVTGSINKLVDMALTAIPDMLPEQITAFTIAGNSTMTHLLLGIDPSSIRNEPYIPITTRYPVMKAGELRLHAHPNAPVVIAPTVSGYLGGDITAGILATAAHESEEITLYIDIGTNGETVLGNSEWMMGCACSAGPAFEGGVLRNGMRAANGAIHKFDYKDNEVVLHSIGDIDPRGICGSAMIDLLYQLYKNGIMNQKGKFYPATAPKRIKKSDYGFEYRIWESPSGKPENHISVNEPEIDNLIRTKGAIWAGLYTLLKNVEIKPEKIERIIIAGNFGRSLNIEHSIGIGMFPDISRERYTYIGNGSLLGATLLLHSSRMLQQIHDIARKITYMELSTTPGYMDEFVASLFIPHTDTSLFPSV